MAGSENATLLSELAAIFPGGDLVTNREETKPFSRGYRYGSGHAVAVLRPRSLVQMWRGLQACVRNGAIVICQGANTGLNGGSTPFDDYDRPVVVISTSRLGRIDVINGGTQVICLPGASLYDLEKRLKAYGREPHSVIGSTNIGATIVGGVANNSGGALIHRGPAYTQLALFAHVDADGALHLVNKLGVDLGNTPEEILSALDRKAYGEPGESHLLGSDPDYEAIIRDVSASTPARYNNDPRLQCEASGSAGKLCVFALRLDTFPAVGETRTIYLGSNSPEELSGIRRHVLTEFPTLPVTCEYIHRDASELTLRYAKDLCLLLKYGGPRWVGRMFKAKQVLDRWVGRLPGRARSTDALLQWIMDRFSMQLPRRLIDFGRRYEHVLVMKLDARTYARDIGYFQRFLPSPTGDFIECTPGEALAAFRHRYAVGAAAMRYRMLNRDTVNDIAAFDVALPRNATSWLAQLPAPLEGKVEQKIFTGHFLCNVFHFDYALKKGVSWIEFENDAMTVFENSGASLPAEHSFGHLYRSAASTQLFHRALDPTNTFNPGIGRTSKLSNWA